MLSLRSQYVGPASGESENTRPKNIILLIGDGMGLSQMSAGLYDQQNPIALEYFPVVGFQKTFSSDNLVTDSAASGTAMACGKKTFNNAIGVDKNGKPCTSILEEAENHGLATGLVVTSSIVHATPAAFIAHQQSRNLYEQIAADFLSTEIDLFIGGGKQFFDRRESDDRDLVAELRKKNYAVYDYFNNDLTKIQPSTNKNFGFFTADNQPLPAIQGRDYLPYASEMAARFLEQRSNKGFFMMIEGSQIDWSCHANQAISLLGELRDFDKTIKKVLKFAIRNKETLVVVTADHETGGLAINPGSSQKKLDLKFTTNGHTATMVPVYAFGPGAELFRGIYDNTTIHEKLMTAFGFDQTSKEK
ncbi:MAG: alkaline phosphatase [Lewinellaceae bacterium]|nr:alkaline phosphatase [Saprospiraceae bacterium]MCB9339918.1 alkaline phosphatase [Lewinellaceae bacterium]